MESLPEAIQTIPLVHASGSQTLDKGKGCISDTIQTLFTNSRPNPTSPMALTSSVGSPPKGSALLKFFEEDPRLAHLTPEQKNEVIRHCLENYEQSVIAFDQLAAEAAAAHPDAQACANEMCRRLVAVVHAYQEVMAESKTHYSPHLRELTVRLGRDLEFMSRADGKGAGSVSYNPITIETAMQEGNMREKMTLIYSAIWDGLPKVFAKPEVLQKVNEKLAKLPSGAFQLNTNRILTETTLKKTYFQEAGYITEYRSAGHRQKVPDDAPKAPNPQLKDIPDLTIREARATLEKPIKQEEFQAMKAGQPAGQELGQHQVQWIRGGNLYQVDPKSDFYKKAIALGGLPLVSGPSGTTDGLMHGLDYLNMQGYEEKLVLACAAWMVRAGDHSLHEIREASSWHGINYPEGPSAFENIYPKDPDFIEGIKTDLSKQGMELPGYYLSAAHQFATAQSLGFV